MGKQDNGEPLNIIHLDRKHRTFPSKLRYRRAWNAGFACDAAWRSELRFGRNDFNMNFSSSAFASRTEGEYFTVDAGLEVHSWCKWPKRAQPSNDASGPRADTRTRKFVSFVSS